MNFQKYKEIANNIGAKEVLIEIDRLEEKYNNKELNIVLVGEFSSGKTTLINRFFNINLPTNVTPETATIWKIKGCDEEKYVVHFKNGESKEVTIDNIAKFDQKEISFIDICVKDFDRNINFVDTPGLSSLDEFHKKALEDYIEEADVVLLVADINQGLVATSKKFLEEHLTNSQKVYVTLTKGDTKSEEDIKKQREYIANNFKGFEKVIVVSKDNLEELKDLLGEIKRKKEEILTKRVEEKLNHICRLLENIIVSLLDVDTSDIESLKQKRREIEAEIEKIEDKLAYQKEELKRKIEVISNKSAKIVFNTLNAKKEYIAEALWDNNLSEGINDRLRQVLEEAIKDVNVYIENELKKDVEELRSLTNLRIEDMTISVIDLAVRFREIVIGGLLVILSKLPYIGPLVLGFKEIVQGLLEQATKIVSKRFVMKKLDEAFSMIDAETEKVIKSYLESNLDLIFDEFAKDLKFRKKSFEESLDKLEYEIKNKKAEIKEYVNRLKNYKNELQCKEEV